MARAWSEVSSTPQFQALSSADQEAARQQYFAQVVAPQVPADDMQAARSQFDNETRSAKTAAPVAPVPPDAAAGQGAVDPSKTKQEPVAPETPKWAGVVGRGTARVKPPAPTAVPTPAHSVLERPDPNFQPSEADLIQASKSPDTIAREQANAVYDAKLANAPQMQAAAPPSMVDRASAAARDALGRHTVAGQVAGGAVQKGGDLYLSASQILPQTLKLASDIVQLGTGGMNSGFSRWLQSTSDAMGDQQSSKLKDEHAQLSAILADPKAGALDVAKFLAAHPEYTINAAIPSVGSMVLGVGGARMGAAAAQRIASARGAVGAELAAAGGRGAGIGANAANSLMNAGSTFDDTKGDTADKYAAAGIAAGTTAVGGRLFDDGAEAAIARHAQATTRARSVLGTMAKEGGQEAFEQAGQEAGQSVGEGRPFDLDNIGKQAVAAGGLGAVMGAGAGATLPAGKQEQSANDLARSKGFLRPVEVRKQATQRFEDFAATHGMAPKAEQAVKQAAEKVPLDQLPGFFKRAASAMSARGLVGRQVDDAALASLDEPITPTIQQPTAAPPAPSGDFSGLAEDAAPAPVEPVLNTPTDQAAHGAATSPTHELPPPTDAQKEAGNYKLGHLNIGGLDISIENPQGSMRSGTNPDGTPWATEMQSHYGYVKGTLAGDGDHSDVFVKPGTPADYSGPVYVIDQIDPKTGRFDEHKSIIGAGSVDEARALYQANYSPGWKGLGAITEVPLPAFKSWVKDGVKNKPLGDITGAVNDRGLDASRAPDVASAAANELPDASAVGRNTDVVSEVQPIERAAGHTAEPAANVEPSVAAVHAGSRRDDALKVPHETPRIVGRYGKAPGSATAIELRPNADGTLTAWAEGHEMLDYDSGDPIRVPASTGDEDAVKLIRKAGAISSSDKIYPAKAAETKPSLKAKRNSDGTVLVKGDPAAITSALPDFKGIKGARGITYGRTIADKVVAALDAKNAEALAPATSGGTGGTEPVASAPVVAPDKDVAGRDSETPASTAEVTKRPNKPRMGETADDLWAAIKKAAGGVVSREAGSRIVYPTLRVVGGDDFRLGPKNQLVVVDRQSGGVGVRDATKAEANEFHNDLSEDRVQVLLMTAPGYGSDYKAQRVVQELHSPSGLGFKGATAPSKLLGAGKPTATKRNESVRYTETKAEPATERKDDGNVAMFHRKPLPFSEALDGVLDGRIPESTGVRVSDPLPVLSALGMRDLPVATTGDRLSKMHFDHGLTRSELKRLPELLASPMLVFESATQPGSKVAVLDLMKNGAPVIAAIRPDAKLGRLDVNLLASAYAKDNAGQIGKWIEDGLLRYADKDKTRALATSGGVQVPWLVQLRRGSGKSVLGPSDVGKAEGGAEFKRSDAKTAAMRRTMTQEVVDILVSQWENSPPVVVIGSMAEAPESVRRENDAQLSQGADGEPAGFIRAGKVYIVASQMAGMRDVATTLFHEVLGHYGLRGVFGPELNTVLEQMIAARPDAVKAKAKEYGLDITDEKDRLRAAEEVLAELAQTRPTSTWVQRAIAAIRTWLRAHVPFLHDLKLSDTEIIRDFIMPARRYVEQGPDIERAFAETQPAEHEATDTVFSRAPATDSDAFKKWFGDSKVVDERGAPLVVYHGTKASFGAFSEDKLGSNTGSPSAHEGYFFTDDASVASGYSVERISRHLDDVQTPEGRAIAQRIERLVEQIKDSDDETFEQRLRGQVDQLYQDLDAAESSGANVMPTHLSMANPLVHDFNGKARDKSYRDLLKQAKREGRDGVILRNTFDHVTDEDVRPHHVYVVFRPEQVKSAIGNRGTFDPSDERIAFSRRHTKDEEEAMLRAGIGGGPRKLADKVKLAYGRAMDAIQQRGQLAAEARQGTLDQFHGIDRAIKREIGNLPAEQDPYIAARLANGGTSSVMRALMLHGQAKWAANGQHLEKIEGTDGLLDILKPLGGDINDWFGWMIGNRAARLKTEGREHNFTGAQIKALQGLAAGKEVAFQKAAMEYAAFKRSVLDIAEQAGLIDPEARKAWDHADYIPFYRQIDERSTFSPTGRKGLAGQSSGIRTLNGGEAALNDPMENLLMNFSRLVDASLKNNALRKTIDALKHTDTVERTGYAMSGEIVPAGQVKKVLVEAGTPESVLAVIPEAAFNGMAKMWAIQPPTDPAVVRVMEGGKPQFYRVLDPLLLKSMTSFVPFDFPGLGVMRAFKRVLTATVTATPEFMIRNWIRDSLASQAITKDGFSPGKSLTGIAKSYRELGGFENMLFAGASFQSGNINAANPEGTATALRRALRDKGFDASSADAFVSSVLDTPAKFWEKYRHIGEAVENANREAVYEAAIKSGKSVTAAAYEAKDLMDFSLRGGWAAYQLLADVLPFFNARVQGLYRLGRSDPKRLVTYGLIITAASVMLALANAGDDWYEELPDWDKDNYWHFRVGGQHLRIPKPFELGAVFATVPERITRYLAGRDAGSKTLGRVWATVRDQLAFDPVPQMIRPALNVYANTDSFRGTPIENMADEGKLPSMRYSTRTSETARAAVQAVAPTADAVGLSPKRLEYLVGGYLGTAGLYALGLSDLAVRYVEGKPPAPEWRADDYPVVKSFYRVDPARATVFESDLYKLRTEIEEVYKSVRAAEQDQNPAQRDAIIQAHKPELAARDTVATGAGLLRQLNKEQDAVYADRAMTPQEKRKRLDTIQSQKNKIAKMTMQSPAVTAAN